MKGPKILVVVGGALVALSSVLAWINLAFIDGGFQNLHYLSSTYGKLALAVGLVLVVIGLGLFSQWGAQPVVAQAAVAIAAVAVVLAILGMLDTNSRLADYRSIANAAVVPGPERAAAPFVDILGGLLALGGSLALVIRHRGTAPTPGRETPR